MTSRDKISFEVENVGRFTIYAEPTFLEQRQIDNLLGELFGSHMSYEDYRIKVSELAEKLIPNNSQEHILNNAHQFALLFTCNEELTIAKAYARISVVGIENPESFESLSKEQMLAVARAMEDSLETFFRKVEKREFSQINNRAS